MRTIARGWESLTGPVSGIMAARQGVMVFRNDEQIETLDTMFNSSKGEGFFTTVVFECSSTAAMNWYVPEKEVDDIVADLGQDSNRTKLDRLKRWWDS